MELEAKHQGKLISLPRLALSLSMADLKHILECETMVPVHRQKLLGLVKGKLPGDEVRLSELALKGKPPHKFMLMGTPDSQLFVDPADRADLPEVFDDFDLDFSSFSTQWHRSRRNAEQLVKFTNSTTINLIKPPRSGKPLLVLDLDHTLLEFSREGVTAEQMKRPHMDW